MNKQEKLNQAIQDILSELESAERKYPDFPADKIHAVSVMNEEAGESIRAVLNHVYHNGSIEEVRKELIQTGAMVIRNLIHL